MRRNLLTAVILLVLSSHAVAAGMVIEPGANIHFQNQVFDAEGSAFAVKATSGIVRFTDCDFKNAKYYLLDLNGPVTAVIDGCTFSNTMHAVRLRGAAKGFVAHSSFEDWLHYGVLVEGTEEAGPVVTVDDCAFARPKAGKGGARQMVVATNPNRIVNILDLRVTNNRCLGPGEPYDRKSDTSVGTADQISLNYCSRFTVTGNTSTGGGENGITITNQCSHGIVSGNLVERNDGHGIQVASRGEGSSDVSIFGNSALNNGLRQDGQSDTIAGIYVQDGKRISIAGNTINGPTKFGVLVAESEHIAIGENPSLSSRDDFVPVQVYADRPIIVSRHWGIQGPATISSTADPIIQVDDDDVTIERLTILGRFKSDRQRGIFSETAKNGSIEDCSFAGMTNGIKLDRAADGWNITRCEFSNILGVDDGYGYGILVGVGGNHRISHCVGRGSPGRGRHFVYLSGGASNCRVSDCTGDGWNSTTFAMYALAHQQPCTGNVFERCTAKNQKRGQADTAALEISGKCTGTIVRDFTATNIAGHAVVVSTQGWVSESNTLLERLRIDGCDWNGLFIRGARGVELVGSEIRNVSRESAGKHSCVDIQAWYQRPPKQATSRVAIRENRFGIKGARAAVSLNPTDPKPSEIVQDNNTVHQ